MVQTTLPTAMQSTDPIMHSAEIFKHARAGDAGAIANLLNRTLANHGVNVKASIDGHRLHLTLRGQQIPDQKIVAPLIQRGMKRLACPTIESVNLEAQQSGDNRTAWEYRFRLSPNAQPTRYQQPQSESLVQIHIEPETSSQANLVVIGDRSLHSTPQGAIVHLRQESPLQPSRRHRPTADRYCEPFRNLLDRHPETQESLSALRVGLPVEFHGEQGLGKSALLRYLAHRPEMLTQFPDGVVYHRVQDQPLEDLTQFLFDAFYEYNTTRPTKPTEDELYESLLPLRALVVLDEVELDPIAIDRLVQEETGLALLMASVGSPRWSEGRTIPMRGLPIPDAMELIERHLGQTFYDEERTQVEALCRLLKGHPLRMIQTVSAARASADNQSRSGNENWLQDLTQLLQSGESPEAIAIRAATGLPEIERRLLAVLAVFGVTPVAASHLKALSAATNLDLAFQTLVNRGLVWTDGVRYRLAGNLVYLFQHIWDLSPWIERSLSYFKEWAKQQRAPATLAPALDIFWKLTSIAAEHGHWQDVLELSLLLDEPLFMNKRWGQWQQVWNLGLEAARSLGDGAAEAYALHQLGSRALAVDDAFSANAYLTEAIQIRTQLGNAVGAAASQHNLNLLLPPAPKSVSRPVGVASGVIPTELQARPAPAVQDVKRAEAQPVLSASPEAPFDSDSNSPESAQQSFQDSSQQSQSQSAPPPETELEPQKHSLSAVGVGEALSSGSALSSQSQDKLESQRQDRMARPGAVASDDEDIYRSSISPDKKPPYVWIGVLLVAAIAGGVGAFVALPFNNAPFSFSKNSVEFPPQLLNVESSSPRSVIVTNNGSEAIDIASVVFSKDDRLDFSLEEDCTDAPLLPDDDCIVSVNFAPREEGPRSTKLRIADRTGEYVRTMSVRGIGATAEIGFSPEGLSFEPTLSGQSSQETKTLSVTNDSAVSFTMGEASLTGEGAEGFAIARNGCAGQPLDPGDTCTVDVAFDPPGAGSYQANLSITDATGKYRWASALAGTGRLSAPAVSPARIAFGQSVIGSRSSQTVTLSNTGTAPLDIQNLRLQGDTSNFSIAADGCTRNPVRPGSSCRITLNFMPQSVRNYSASLVIADNAVGSPRQVSITGQGSRITAPSFTPSPLVFGELEVNGQRQESITLTNRGSGSLRVRDVSLAASDDFTIVSNSCAGETLTAGGTCRIGIRFSPETIGDRSTTLTISDSASGSPRTVSIRGTGVAIPAPEILSLEASPQEVNAGEQSNLCYRVANVSQLSLRNDSTGSISPLDPSSACVSVSPAQSSTYTLIAQGRTGQNETRQIRVRVAEAEVDTTPPATPAAIGPANNEYVMCGSGATSLRWNPVSDNGGSVRYVVTLQSGGSAVDGTVASSWTQATRQTVDSTSLNVTSLLTSGRVSYRWQVSAIDAAGNESPPSGWLYFRTCADVEPL